MGPNRSSLDKCIKIDVMNDLVPFHSQQTMQRYIHLVEKLRTYFNVVIVIVFYRPMFYGERV